MALGDVYEKTDATTWIKRANIAGPQGASNVPLLVTSLPASPVDGQEVYYLVPAPVGSAVYGDTVWRLRYRAATAGAYKWHFLGGPPLYRHSDFAGPAGYMWGYVGTIPNSSILIPLPGQYLIEANVFAYAGTPGAVGYIGATVSTQADPMTPTNVFAGDNEFSKAVGVGGYQGTVNIVRWTPTVPAGRTAKLWASGNGGYNLNCTTPENIFVTPILVG